MARESGCRRGAVKKVDFIFVHLYTPPRRNNLPTYWNHSRHNTKMSVQIIALFYYARRNNFVSF